MGKSRALMMSWFKGNGLAPDAPKGKSYDKAYQDQKPDGHTYKRVKEGHSVKTVEVPYYNKEKPKTTTVVQQVAAPAPAPKPVEKKIEAGSFKVTPEVQQAKERVNAYEPGESPWEQAQANVQSSFIQSSTSSNPNQQYDFSGDSFNANESPEPNEQAQSAQNQLQNYVSKYSQYKSSTN